VIPKKYIPKGNIEVKDITIRDHNWNEIFSQQIVGKLPLFEFKSLVESEDKKYIAFSTTSIRLWHNTPNNVSSGIIIWNTETNKYKQVINYNVHGNPRYSGPLPVVDRIRDNKILEFHKPEFLFCGNLPCRTIPREDYEYNILTGDLTQVN
jgi:hypothetical protein